MTRSKHFEGEITVSSRIVDSLSSGLYESPAACLKELINNSYDADATLVEVFVKPDADRIIISDDGHGMNRAEFMKHFTRISESHKRDDSDVTALGRKKIGKIGIGFIAANEICDEMEIISTKEGSPELLRVTIHFDKMRQDIEDRRRAVDEIAKADYSGTVEEAPKADHYTRIFLKRVRGEARAILAGARSHGADGHARSLYGLSPSSVRDLLARRTPSSWSGFDEYSRTVLRVGLNVPVRYHERWMPQRELQKVHDIVARLEGLRFQVEYDGTDLRKPIVLFPPGGKTPDAGRCFVRRFEFDGAKVSASGYFYVQHGTIKPEELQGVVIRIREAAVGGYDSTFLDFPSTEGSLIQRWVSAEVWADDRLEDAMNIDRKTLRIAHPAYVELQQALHLELRSVIGDARKRLYEAGSAKRRSAKADEALSQLRRVIQRDIEPSNPTLAATLERELRKTRTPARDTLLARRLTVPQLYDLVVTVAKEVLSPAQFNRFVQRLTERLNE